MKSWRETMLQIFARQTHSGGGFIWFHRPTGAACAGAAVCPDGRTRAVRFLSGGHAVYAGAWAGSVRIRGRAYRGTVYIAGETERPTVRFAFELEMLARRFPRYDSPFQIVGPAPTDPAGAVCECVSVRFDSDGRPVPTDGGRVWIETETAIAEGIDPYADA